MKKIATWLGIVLIAATVLFATGCPERESISKIQNNPAKYSGKEVVIAGTVQKGYGFSVPVIGVGGGVYRIDDGTGSMWVVTDRNVPTQGTRIGIKGRVQDGVNYGGKNYGLGIYENERRIK
jgi:hypothetical protein